MTEPTEQQIPAEPHEGIDAFANKESRANEENHTSAIVRSGGEGPPPTDAPLAGEAPVVEGTGAGNPLQGVRVEDE
ncbi:MAG: hypothetical protein ABI345_09175 [Jatrophihabitans sp.]